MSETIEGSTWVTVHGIRWSTEMYELTRTSESREPLMLWMKEWLTDTPPDSKMFPCGCSAKRSITRINPEPTVLLTRCETHLGV